MKKIEVVKDQREFDSIIKTSPFEKNKYFLLYNKESDVNFPRFGIAVGTKVGNAVTRNRLKRQIRAIIDKNKKLFSNHRDYIIIVKRNCLEISFHEMEQNLISLIKG